MRSYEWLVSIRHSVAQTKRFDAIQLIEPVKWSNGKIEPIRALEMPSNWSSQNELKHVELTF